MLTRTRRLTALLTAVVALASLAACADRRSNAEPKKTERSEQLEAIVSIDVAGDISGKIEGHRVKTQLVMLETDDPELARNRIYGIETVDPVKIGTVAFSTGFAVLPYRGPGKYRIGEGSIHEAIAAGPEAQDKVERSSVKVLWWPDNAVMDSAYDFYRRVEPCAVVIEKAGNKGSLKCPRLSDEHKQRHFSLDLRWEFPTA